MAVFTFSKLAVVRYFKLLMPTVSLFLRHLRYSLNFKSYATVHCSTFQEEYLSSISCNLFGLSDISANIDTLRFHVLPSNAVVWLYQSLWSLQPGEGFLPTCLQYFGPSRLLGIVAAQDCYDPKDMSFK